jgi:hypothetical protein
MPSALYIYNAILADINFSGRDWILKIDSCPFSICLGSFRSSSWGLQFRGFCQVSLGFLWGSLGVPSGFLRGSFGVPSGFLRGSFGVPSGFLRGSFGVPSGFLRGSFGVPSGFFRGSFGVPSGFLRGGWMFLQAGTGGSSSLVDPSRPSRIFLFPFDRFST